MFILCLFYGGAQYTTKCIYDVELIFTKAILKGDQVLVITVACKKYGKSNISEI